MDSETLITAIVTGVLTYFATQTKSRYDLKGKEVESDSTTEGMYAQHMSTVLSEYKEQVSGFREEISVLRDENQSLKSEFKKLKTDMEAEKEKERVYFTTEIEKRDDRIEELETIVVEKDEVIETLKGVD